MLLVFMLGCWCCTCGIAGKWYSVASISTLRHCFSDIVTHCNAYIYIYIYICTDINSGVSRAMVDVEFEIAPRNASAQRVNASNKLLHSRRHTTSSSMVGLKPLIADAFRYW
jgi:hypothetical protein